MVKTTEQSTATKNNAHATPTHEATAPLTQEAQNLRTEVRLGLAAQEVSHSLLSSERSFRVAIAQISTDPGDIKGNTAKIIDYITEAKRQGAQLVVFPELAVPGYCAMDLLFNKSYIAENIAALQAIKQATAGITAIVGFVDCDWEKSRAGGRPVLYNSAAIVQDGKIVAVQDKTLLPNYNIFFEDRYFSAPREIRLVEVDGIKVGTEICEDLWSEGYADNPTGNLVQAGADLVVNISASPFNIGKLPVRSNLIQQVTKEHKVPFLYANLIGGFDGYEGEVVFDGRSMIVAPDGKLAALGKPFQEDLVVVDLNHAQELSLPEVPEVQELYEALVLGIKDYFRRIGGLKAANFKRAVIGLSGGIDSAVVAALAVEALGKDRVLGITMPSRYSSQETKGDAYQLADNLGIPCKTVPIEAEVQAALTSLRADPEIAELPEDVAEENVQARLRMINLMFYANKMHGLVLNTGNKTELALDNCTIYGDMVGGFSVLGDVDKDRVYELAAYINERAGREVIPQTTIDRPPSAELKPDQLDALVMGGEPRLIAPAIRTIVEESLTLKEALERYGNTFGSDIVERWYARLDRSEWKRRQAAPAIRVTPLAFGNGRRMPMNHGYRK